jgi:hypothetical protein
VNDVFLKASDVLEVLHQHKKSGAGISTAWDWMERRPEYYYDVWVGRTVRARDITCYAHCAVSEGGRKEGEADGRSILVICSTP